MTNDRFRDSLEIDFGGMTLDDKKQLEVLMRVAGYNRFYSKEKKQLVKRNPTTEQLDYAWKYLKGLK